MSTAPESTASSVDLVADLLEEYARRGVFRGFGRGDTAKGKTKFKMVWHYERLFELVFDASKGTLRIPLVLPKVEAKSAMHREFKSFLKAFRSEALPEHRRVDPDKVEIKSFNRGGNISLTAKVKNGDFEYAARKLIHVVHEIFLVFLYDGRNYEYLIETFDIDPDHA